MTVLSRMAKLGIAAESSAAQYAAPAFTITFARPATYRQVIEPLKDTALRGEGTWLEDAQQGPWHTEWQVPSDGYPDLAGWYLRAVIGPDTCTPGVTTALTASAQAGATTLVVGAAPPAGAVLMIGAGDTLEYARCGTPSGLSVPLASPLRFAHNAAEPVLSQASHVFTQAMCAGFPSYSLTMDDGTGPLGWPGCVMSALRITIDAGGYVKFRASWTGFPATAVSTFTYAASPMQPMAGWDWQIMQASLSGWHNGVLSPVVRPLSQPDGTVQVASTRGQKMDLTLSRKTAAMNTICGQQAPYVISTGPMRADGTYTAIYEDQSDMDLFLAYGQQPVTHVLAQPVLLGGCALALELPRAGWLQGDPENADTYLAATYRLSGIASPSPGPAVSASLLNYVQEAYGP
jgi:hypothetical protein